MMYTDLLTLVSTAAERLDLISRRKRSTVFTSSCTNNDAEMRSSTVSLDMSEVFGKTIEIFYSRQAKVVEAIWSHQFKGLSAEEGMKLSMTDQCDVR